MSRAGVVSAAARRQRLGDAGLSRALRVYGSNGASGSSEQRPTSTVAPSCEGGGRELLGEARLTDPRLAGDQHDPPVAVHLHAAPTGAQPRQLGAAADEHRFVRAREAGWWRDGLWLRAAEFVDQRSRLARRRDAELRAQALGEVPAGRQRRGAVAARGEPLDQSAVGRFRQRVERDLGARQPNRLRWIERGGRSRLERAGEPVCVLVAGLDRPLFVEAVEDRRAARLERPRCDRPRQAPAETRARQL